MMVASEARALKQLVDQDHLTNLSDAMVIEDNFKSIRLK
jgi:hypothetical protein